MSQQAQNRDGRLQRTCRPGSYGFYMLEKNERLHNQKHPTGKYTPDQVLQVLNNIAHQIQLHVNEILIKFTANVHTSVSKCNKTMTYRATLGSKSYTIEFQLTFCDSISNLKTIKNSVSSFRVRGTTLVSSQKTGLNVLHSSADHHLFHNSVHDLSLDACPGAEELRKFILNYFNLNPKTSS